MSLTKRRLLFYFFILLFITIVPIVLLYATGYTVNWRRIELEKTASLVIDSEPNNAKILLNGQSPASLANNILGLAPSPRTKAKLTGLLPGNYSVRLEQDGYIPWQEHINVKPGEVFNLGTVRLFKQSSPTLLQSLPENATLSVSPRQRYLSAIKDSKVRLISLPEAQIQETTLPAIPEKGSAWSKDENYVLIGQRFVLNTEGKILADLAEQFKNVSGAHWDADDNNRLYILAGQRLVRFSVKDKAAETTYNADQLIGGGAVSDFRTKGDKVYLIIATKTKQELVITDLSFLDRTIRTTLGNEPFAFFDHPSGLPALLNTATRQLKLIEQPLPLISSYRLSPIADNFFAGRWNSDGLLYTTPFEIRQWAAPAQTDLIARFGESIKDILPLENSPYVAYATATELSVLPIHNEPFSQSIQLANFENIATIVTMDKGALYLVGRTNGSSGLFSLTIY